MSRNRRRHQRMVHKSQHQRQPHRHQLHTTILIIIRVITRLIMETISSMEPKRMEIVIVITTIVMVITANGIMDGNGR